MCVPIFHCVRFQAPSQLFCFPMNALYAAKGMPPTWLTAENGVTHQQEVTRRILETRPLTKCEVAKAVALRAQELSQGDPPRVFVPEVTVPVSVPGCGTAVYDVKDPIEVAFKELTCGTFPKTIEVGRTLNGDRVYVCASDLAPPTQRVRRF